MPRTEAGRRRCAIYTRKSSEEGLEQEFNSLAAQREACEAFIRSQQHEGWVLGRPRYDDGGFSGGNLERPALQRLLTDIRTGRIDIVVVYKVDRLTRSLADFARLIELFDAEAVSFVSVTQQFNTTSSMGRLIINLPPRHLKSLMASIAFPAWYLGLDPSVQILCVSYAQDLADKLARDCRSIMISPWYQQVFATRLAPHRQAVQEFITTCQGYRLATSTGGVLTGRGADIILIDDPLKPDESLSDAQRQAANEWYDHTLYSRQNDKQRGAIVIIMQRLHEDDLVGHVLGQEDWEVLSFPAIAEADECGGSGFLDSGIS